MAKLKVYTFPDLILTKKAEPIQRVEKTYFKLADDMLETMYEAPGIGLAFKESLTRPGPWTMSFAGFGEMLPDPNNRATLHRATAYDTVRHKRLMQRTTVGGDAPTVAQPEQYELAAE